MSAPNTISIDKLVRLIGTPKCPVLVDVRGQDDFDVNPHFIPSSIHRASNKLEDLPERHAGSAVVICQQGTSLSQGAAALLRDQGVPAEVLEGGFEAWRQARLPLVPFAKLPPVDPRGRTVWVTRARPKIDRIACPWLIRRFVDPTAVSTIALIANPARLRWPIPNRARTAPSGVDRGASLDHGRAERGRPSRRTVRAAGSRRCS